MTYSIKLHFLSNPEYETRFDEISDAYNETLELLWKEKEVFYDEIRDEFTEKHYIDWVEYEQNERYEEFFEYEWMREIHYTDNSYHMVTVYFNDIQENEIDDFQENFFNFLKDKVHFIYKFEDTRFLEIRKQFFEDIYKIETNLREVITFIFITTYYDFGDFLKDLKINDITWKLKLSPEDLKENFENEFFYISFKDYKNLLELKPLSEQEKTQLLEDSSSFDERKKRIFERGIKDEPYIAFIESIKQDLEVLENFRNAIMHSHNFTDKLKQNYEKSRDEILEKIENFTETHINIFWNELGLIVGKKYTMLQDLPSFIQWKKYELKEIAWGSDAVFTWEDWDDVSFFDKEFNEYWSE